MRHAQPLTRSAPAAAAVTAALALAAAPAAAGPGISVSANGSTVSVTTSACTLVGGGWGTASLLAPGQTSFAQGRRSALAGTTVSQSAAWQSVRPGTYTVIVVCSDNITAGTQSIVVAAASKPAVSATSAPARPSRGVMGGLGGAVKDYRTVTFAAGGALVGAGLIATGWVLRRRSRPYRL
ncbi:hypothetical protein ABZ719_21400 [Streptomyces sp. NPDC006743]|uniref:hypothetical protein n=1 Tax=Streptomyces sp. NPDC006743 TaxID=3154480 RepID=UPI0034526051